jgi:hypothetical protein
MCRAYLVVLCAILSLFFSSCSPYKEVQFSRARKLQLDEWGGKSVHGSLMITLENPNWYEVTLIEGEVELALQGRVVGHMHLAEPISLPKKSKNDYLLKIYTDDAQWDGIASGALTALFADEILLNGQGYIVGNALKFKKKYDIQFSYPIPKSALQKKQ